MNLYQKLVEIRKQVKYAQKSSKGYDFQYANESQILGSIRPKMDELNVFLETEIVSLESIECEMLGTRTNPGNKKVLGVRATFKFTWVNADNPSEKSEKTMVLQDSESDVQTVGGLMTYANRYFLYKSFSVPTDKEDPDAFENSKKRFAKKEDSQPALSEKLTVDEVRQIEEYVGPNKELTDKILKGYKVTSLSEIKKENFVPLIRTLEKRGRGTTAGAV
jgi:hypothetical protein